MVNVDRCDGRSHQLSIDGQMKHWLAIVVLTLVAGCSTGTSAGVVTEVEGPLSEVESFTVLSEGEAIVFLPVEGQTYDFALDHLRDHLRSGEPVVVEWEIRNGVHYALAITDG